MKRNKFRYLIFLLIGILILGFSTFSFGDNSASSGQNSDSMVLSPSAGIGAAALNAQTAGDSIFLHTGSPLLLKGDKIMSLDPLNYDVVATVINNRTLVPLRALAEYFGALVSYDAKNRTAIIAYDGVNYEFPIGEKYYRVVDGDTNKTMTMDTGALILRDRTMVPLRAICEEILKKEVGYRDGVISISSKALNLTANPELVAGVKNRIGTALKVQSKTELARLMSSVAGASNASKDGSLFPSVGIPDRQQVFSNESAASQESAPADVGSDSSAGSGSSSGPDYSSTNTQVAGIDEADIVKTDGKYLYIAGNQAVRIVRADQSNLSEASTIKLPDQKNVQEIYVDGNRLVLVGNRYENTNGGGIYPQAREDIAPDSVVSGSPDSVVSGSPGSGVTSSPDSVVSSDVARILPMPPYYSKTYSYTDVYDITDPNNPVLLKSHEMEGSYQTSRKTGPYVYLVTNTYVYGDGVIPLMRDTAVSKNAYPVALNDVMIMPDCRAPGYVVLSAMDITDDSRTQVEAITANGYQMYMNESSIYFAGDNYDGNTAITKFKIDGLNMGYAGAGRVKGTILNQFSMDEYDGNLRIATTTWENGNNLYVLSDSLAVIGSVTDLAKGEQIYSVRFMGEKGYIVTFRTMDPLFVFDLSDPENPKLTGELKIPGFSNYLHPVGENLLLGLGVDTQELYTRDSAGNETVVGTRQGGIKISLFDVSDMGKPREVTNYVIGDNGSYSEAFYNHKAIMVDPVAKNIAFDAYIADGKDWNRSKQGALVISFANSRISEKGTLSYTQPEVYGKYIPYGRRVAYIGDTLYYVQDGIVKAYQYSTLKLQSTLVLK